MSKTVWVSVAETNVGTVRKVNEDHFLQAPDALIWCVADGMGGHSRGDIASQMITQQIHNLIEQSQSNPSIEQIVSCIKSVNHHLVSLSQGSSKIIGSTVAVLLIENNKAHCIWAGDSRIYRVRDRQIQRMTRDHSQVEDMIDDGLITPEKAESHPNANIITRAVGACEHLDLEVRSYDLEQTDTFILCSDGLNKVISDLELEQFVLGTHLSSVANTLVEKALTRNATDNITVLAVANKNDDVTNAISHQDLMSDMTLPFNHMQ